MAISETRHQLIRAFFPFFGMIVPLKRLISGTPGTKLHTEKISEMWTWQIHRK